MSRGLGVKSARAIVHTTVVSACIGASVGLATLPARAGDAPSSSATRYGESELLDAARRAAGNSSENKTVNIGVPPADELRILEARREAELKRLSEKLKRAAEARGPVPAEVPTTPAWATEVVVAPADPIDAGQRSALGAPNMDAATTDPTLKGHATVLMVMAPSETGRTYRPNRPTDPILCLTDGCYVSNGPQAPATYHSFSQSLGLGGRLGRGAGACNHTQACVFRNVDLGGLTGLVQPIDLKFVRHDRREQREVAVDQSCRMIDHQLSCSRPVRTATYTLWIVPESVAREAGPEALAVAVNEGLRTSRSAELPWKQQ